MASHHAGHLPGWKSLVERLFQRYGVCECVRVCVWLIWCWECLWLAGSDNIRSAYVYAHEAVNHTSAHVRVCLCVCVYICVCHTGVFSRWSSPQAHWQQVSTCQQGPLSSARWAGRQTRGCSCCHTMSCYRCACVCVSVCVCVCVCVCDTHLRFATHLQATAWKPAQCRMCILTCAHVCVCVCVCVSHRWRVVRDVGASTQKDTAVYCRHGKTHTHTHTHTHTDGPHAMLLKNRHTCLVCHSCYQKSCLYMCVCVCVYVYVRTDLKAPRRLSQSSRRVQSP